MREKRSCPKKIVSVWENICKFQKCGFHVSIERVVVVVVNFEKSVLCNEVWGASSIWPISNCIGREWIQCIHSPISMSFRSFGLDSVVACEWLCNAIIGWYASELSKVNFVWISIDGMVSFWVPRSDFMEQITKYTKFVEIAWNYRKTPTTTIKFKWMLSHRTKFRENNVQKKTQIKCEVRIKNRRCWAPAIQCAYPLHWRMVFVLDSFVYARKKVTDTHIFLRWFRVVLRERWACSGQTYVCVSHVARVSSFWLVLFFSFIYFAIC